MSKVKKSFRNVAKMRNKVTKLKDKNYLPEELEILEETRQKAVGEKDRLLKKLEKLNKGKIPYDGEGGFFKKGKLVFKKQIENIWNRSKEADYRRKVLLLLNLKFRKDRQGLRKALEDNKMRNSPRISKMFELFCKKYDVLPIELFKLQPVSFSQTGITGESKIFCRDCGRELDRLKYLPTPLTDDSKVRCPFCHRVKRFKEGYFERTRIFLIVKKDTKLNDIKEAWPEIEFLKRAIFRISFEEKEPELDPNWERDYEWYRLWKFQGKTYLEIAEKEAKKKKKWREQIWEDTEREFQSDKRKHKEVEKEKEEIFTYKWNNFERDRVVGETKLEIIIKKAIVRFENNISKIV